MPYFSMQEELLNAPNPLQPEKTVDITVFAGRKGERLTMVSGDRVKLLLTEDELAQGAEKGDALLQSVSTRISALSSCNVVFLKEGRVEYANKLRAYSNGRPF